MKTIGDLTAANRKLMAPRVMRIVARLRTYENARGDTWVDHWVDRLEFVSWSDAEPLSDVILVPSTGSGKPPELFDGWFEVIIASGTYSEIFPTSENWS